MYLNDILLTCQEENIPGSLVYTNYVYRQVKLGKPAAQSKALRFLL